MGFFLPSKPEDNPSRRPLCGVDSNVSEPNVQSEDDSVLQAANIPNSRVWKTFKKLILHSEGIMTRVAKDFRDLGGQVFIYLEPHQWVPEKTTRRSRASSAAYLIAA